MNSTLATRILNALGLDALTSRQLQVRVVPGVGPEYARERRAYRARVSIELRRLQRRGLVRFADGRAWKVAA